MTALLKLEGAARALAEARTLEDIKQVRDVAEAARQYARAAKLGLEAQNYASEIKLRAERRAGELLVDMAEDEQRHNGRNLGFHAETPVPTLADLGVNKVQSSRWQAIAGLPEERFEEQIAVVKSAGEELTTSRMLREAQDFRREQMRQQIQPAPDLAGPKRYRVVYADPPWKYSDSGLDEYGHAERHYPTMTCSELCDLGRRVRDLCEDNAVLFMWVTSPMLEDALPIIRAWGFEYKTSFVWDKIKHNFGHYNSVRHELLLVCTRGSCTPDERILYDSVQAIERTDNHSEKPEQFRTIIDAIYTHGNRIELFARTKAPGWDVWGNQAHAR